MEVRGMWQSSSGQCHHVTIVFSPSQAHRTHRNRTARTADGFKLQMPGIVDAYMSWSLEVDKPGGLHSELAQPNASAVQGFLEIEVMDVFSKSAVTLRRIKLTHSTIRSMEDDSSSFGRRFQCPFCPCSSGFHPISPLPPDICCINPVTGHVPSSSSSEPSPFNSSFRSKS